jgi:dTMP kinase
MAVKKRGCFITLEGPDGSGKSTQARLLEERLKRLKVPVLRTREPGGSKAADVLRDLLLSPATPALHPGTELFLFLAARHQHVLDTILPALKSGKVVLCDRFGDSTQAYQAGGRGLDAGVVHELNHLATLGADPDLTLLFDLPEAEGLKRSRKAKGGHDRMEQAGLAFHRKVRKAFLEIAKAEPKRVKVLPVAKQTPERVLEMAWAPVSALLKRRGHAV